MKKKIKKKIEIDLSQFELTADDKKQLKSLDKISTISPNYYDNKRVNLDYYNEDELDDVAVDDYSECDGREKIETLGDIGMGIF
jgi:hypothetical protein